MISYPVTTNLMMENSKSQGKKCLENGIILQRKGNNMMKVALHNLGCKVNAYETEAMQELLEQNGAYAELFEVQSRYYQEGREF